MGWSRVGVKAFTLFAGVTTGTTVAFLWNGKCRANESGHCHKTDNLYNNPFVPPVYASWTTNFEPSQKWDANWDRREPSSRIKPLKENASDAEKEEHQAKLLKLTPKANRHLILIRHGQYNLNGEEDIDRTLTALGREQADFAGRRLSELKLPYDKIIHSTLARAVETADIIHKHLPHLAMIEDPILVEGAPIPPEPPIGHWKPEAQQFHEDGARIEAAFRKYFHRADPDQNKDTYEVIVFHANVIRYFVCRALQFPPEAWLRLSLYHASITYMTIRPSGRVGLRTLGDAGFLPADKLTTKHGGFGMNGCHFKIDSPAESNS
ncbi:serine/threonine-protein phosphatase PGAM5, mitochondrial-like isoform X2 [Lineus longissimus]|uniref:serine/threonine-protein phosphatase PGAM5, mitochondrial-like isoform X2 n=1 Tax=Lineus longissimus TaxID=88925 RepID=UPI00315D503B